MNISKNLLSLGLIAVISGISTAQTYTGTAGTNGITDIQSDYSMSTGDGASVSVDVPLEFELPKKVAVTLIDQNGNFSNSNLFSAVANGDIKKGYYEHSRLSFNPTTIGTTSTGRSAHYFYTPFAVYSNSDNIQVSFTNALTFTHETDSTSLIETAITGSHFYNDASTLVQKGNAPVTLNINDLNQNQCVYAPYYYLDMNTIDPTDRAGKYIANSLFTVTVL